MPASTGWQARGAAVTLAELRGQDLRANMPAAPVPDISVDSAAPATRPSAVRTVVLTAASNLALPLSALVTSPLLARSLGPDGRGQLAAVLAPIAFIALFLTLGVPEGLTYLVGSGRACLRDGIRAGLVIAAVVGCCSTAVIFVLAPVLLTSAPQYVGLLRGLALLLPLSLMGATFRGALQGHDDFASVNRERWASVLSRLGLLLVVAAAGMLSVGSAAWITSGTSVVALGFLVAGARRRWSRISGTPAAENRMITDDMAGGVGRSDGPGGLAVLRPLLGYGSKVWLGSISLMIIFRADQVIMAPLVPSAQLGYYAVAVALAEVPFAGFGALRDVLFSRSSDSDDPALVAAAARTCVLVAAPLLTLAVLAVPLAVRVVFGPQFAPAASMAQILLAASLPAGLAAVFGAGLMGRGSPGLLSLAQAGVSAVSVLLVLVLVPQLAGVGAALTSLLTYLLLCALTVALFHRASGLGYRQLLVPGPDDVRQLTGRLRPPRS